MTVTVENLEGVRGYFNRLIEKMKELDFSPIMSSELSELEALHQSYFDARSGPSGEGWEPWYWRPTWAPNDHPTLEITGTLRQSLTLGGSSNIADYDANSLEFGTSVAYAGIQNYGGEVIFTEGMVGRGGGFKPAGTQVELPAREHVGMSDHHVDKLMERLADFVVKGITSEQ